MCQPWRMSRLPNWLSRPRLATTSQPGCLIPTRISSGFQLVPADLSNTIDGRARKDDQSPEEVVRQALAHYLKFA